MYRSILVPIDGSKSSMIGLKHAIALARDQHARIRLLNVVDEAAVATMMGDAAGVVVFPKLIESLRTQGLEALDRAQAAADKAGAKTETVQLASRGQAVSAVILREAKRAKVDLIVMGTHGRRGLNRLLLGSDAERVLRDAPVPVLLTRKDPRARPGASRRAAPEGKREASPAAATSAADARAKSAA
ncbi:MAG: universal stress protein [Burkholderiales bacterium]|nr:universal stress protein [Burkholderiales bacterium]